MFVNRFSRFSYFIPVKQSLTAQQLAVVFNENILKLYRLPKSVVSDRDKLFTSDFWKEFFKMQGTRLQMSTTYHPQTNGQTESVNQYLESYLQCFCSTKQKEWVKWLSWAQFWHNTNWHSITGFSPYEVVYGRPSPALIQYIPITTRVQAMEDSLYNKDHMLKLLKDHHLKSQSRMKHYADLKRTEREFQVGELVLLKHQQYR